MIKHLIKMKAIHNASHYYYLFPRIFSCKQQRQRKGMKIFAEKKSISKYFDNITEVTHSLNYLVNNLIGSEFQSNESEEKKKQQQSET